MTELTEIAERILKNTQKSMKEGGYASHAVLRVGETDRTSVFLGIESCFPFEISYLLFGKTAQRIFALDHNPKNDNLSIDIYAENVNPDTQHFPEIVKILTDKLAMKELTIDTRGLKNQYGGFTAEYYERSRGIDDEVRRAGLINLNTKIYVPRTLEELRIMFTPQDFEEPEVCSDTEDRLMGMISDTDPRLAEEMRYRIVSAAPEPEVKKAMREDSKLIYAAFYPQLGAVFRDALAILDRSGLPFRTTGKRDQDYESFCQHLRTFKIGFEVKELKIR